MLPVAICHPLPVIRYSDNGCRYPLTLFFIRALSSYPFAGIRYLPMICWPLRSRAVNPLPVSRPLSVSRRYLLAVVSRQSSAVVIH